MSKIRDGFNWKCAESFNVTNVRVQIVNVSLLILQTTLKCKMAESLLVMIQLRYNKIIIYMISYWYGWYAKQGRCNRDKPPCKYFHPPQHLKDQLLINGRNHLALKNAILQQMPLPTVLTGQLPVVSQIWSIICTEIASDSHWSLCQSIYLIWVSIDLSDFAISYICFANYDKT